MKQQGDRLNSIPQVMEPTGEPSTNTLGHHVGFGYGRFQCTTIIFSPQTVSDKINVREQVSCWAMEDGRGKILPPPSGLTTEEVLTKPKLVHTARCACGYEEEGGRRVREGSGEREEAERKGEW